VPLRAALAGVVASLIVLGIACQARRPAPTPGVPFSAEGQPVAATGAAERSGRPERVRVVGAGTEGVNLRATPGTAGARLRRLFDGAQLELIGPDRTIEGREWRHVRDPFGRSEGWVAADFLASP
jgi:hypothetical protein